ncbi:MAG: ATP-dependent zinc metalloprotease FtsH [Candidatus Hydrogenedentota bacterium]
MNSFFRSLGFWILIFILIFYAIFTMKQDEVPEKDFTQSEFIEYIKAGLIENAEIEVKGPDLIEIKGKLKHQKNGYKVSVLKTEEFLKLLDEYKIPFKVKGVEKNWFLDIFLPYWGPVILFIILFWLIFARQIQGVGNKAFSFGRSRARLINQSDKKITFNDVAGCDEAKAELVEIIEFLKEPQKFTKLGGRIPKGVLLVGPPGTGKTLLARAVAGEANSPFFSISGSDFVEMFVGVGASRVRDLFDKGKRHAPCIIFIDEIDAVGRHRGAGLGGGHDEREQTLNQILVEMDGFDTDTNVIVVAATNRPDILDPALLRPGRFDRRVVVDLPDLKGRLGILKVHIKKIPLDEGVELEIIARGTPYFSGADIANLVNESALLAARRNKQKVTMEELLESRDKVIMGPERRSRTISEEEKRIIAYHESGHALIAKLLPGTDPVHKVTLIPRGLAYLGATFYLPEKDKYLKARKEYINDIKCLYGGRVAEELIFADITAGAANDIERATEIAHSMVCQFGMSDKMGPRSYGKREEHIFLGREITRERDFSEQTALEIDKEVSKIVKECYEETKKLLLENRDKLDKIARMLIEREVLDGNEVDLLMEGKELPPRHLELNNTKSITQSDVQNTK